MLRPYDSETDYPVVLETAQVHGESIAAIAAALRSRGVYWPNLSDPKAARWPEAQAIDRDICRAWREIKTRPSNPE